MISSFNSLSTIFFFFNDTATTEIYTLSLHDALPISSLNSFGTSQPLAASASSTVGAIGAPVLSGVLSCRISDRKSTRLNSSHVRISYAVFCLKKKKKITYYKILHKRLQLITPYNVGI